MQDLVNRMLEVEREAAALVAAAEAEAGRILETSRTDCETLLARSRQQAGEESRAVLVEARRAAEAERGAQVAAAKTGIDAGIAAADVRREAAVQAMLDAAVRRL